MNIIKPYRPKSGHDRRIRDAFYQSRAWKTFRKSYFMKHPFCVDCRAEGVEAFAVVLDHIHQRSKGGADFPEDSGLRGLCTHHDAIRQAKQSNQARG